jgi:hypothetical protein
MAAVLLLGVALTAVGEPPKDRPNNGRDLTGATTATLITLDRNRMILILIETGDIASGSSVGSGGFWRATTDPYIFASGPNVGAVIPDGQIVFFKGGPFTETGTGGPVFSGQGLDDFFVSTDPADQGNFPDVCTVDDFRQAQFPSLSPFAGEPFPGFADVTVCTASNDITIGTCGTCGGLRVGVEIVEVAFQFSVPAVQDFTFFVFRVFNRTEFLNAGNSPLQPAGPYDLSDVSVAYAIDPDLGEAGDDQIAFFPDVQTMVWWDSDFAESDFQNPPGVGGVTYLKTPVDPATGEEVGLAEFTVFTNGNPRPDPPDKETWYALMIGDPAEVVLEVDPRDIRGMASSATFPLPAGEFVEIYAAIFFADVIGVDPPAQLLAEAYKNLATGEIIEDANDSPVFDNFRNVQRTAQVVFDAGFVVPVAPPKPELTLIPGDGQVSVVWEPSPIESVNPFAKVAHDPFSRLSDGSPDPAAPGTGVIIAAGDQVFDPNLDLGGTTGFRSAEDAGLVDVEATNAAYNPAFAIQDFQQFRVYRSFDGQQDNVQLIASFDLADGIVTGDFCFNAQPVFDATGAFVTSVCIDARELVLGEDTGPNFAIVDRGGPFGSPENGPGLINGIPIFYTVTSLGVNFGDSPVALPSQEAFDAVTPTPAPLVFESGLAPLLSVIPRSNSSAFDFAGVGGTELLGAGDAIVPIGRGPMPNDGTLTPSANTFDYNVTVADPLLIPADFGELRFEINGAGARANWVFDAPASYGDDFVEYGNGAFTDLPAVDVRGREVEYRLTDANGIVLTTLDGQQTEGSMFTDFFAFNGLSFFNTPTFAIVFSDAPDEIAFTASFASSVGDRANQCARADVCTILTADRSGQPASIAVAEFEVGAYGQYHYGDIEMVWSNQGGVLSFSSVRNLSNGVDIPFNDVFGTEGWGFAAETGLGPLEEAVTDGTVPRTASGKVLYPDPNFTFLGGQNSSFSGAEQGAPHYTDLPFDPDIFDKIDQFPHFPQFRAPFMQRGAFQQTAALFTCPAGGGFGCAGAAGLQGTRIWLVGSYIDVSFNNLPADGETWIVQMVNGNATTSRPPVPGQVLRRTLSGATNDLANADLSEVLVVPNPFIAQNEITRGRGLQRILFTNLPPRATVRIYTVSGNLVRVLEHTDESGTLQWDVRTRFDLFVASGNYYFHVTTPDGRTSLGRFAVVN